MKKITGIFCILTFCCTVLSMGQSWDNRRQKWMELTADTLKMDSLSVLPGSVLVFDTIGMALPDTLYHIDYINALFIPKHNLREQYTGLFLEYRVLRHFIPQTIRFKDESFLREKASEEDIFYIYRPPRGQRDVYGLGGLQSSGSISRGISVGNRQDIVVNSTLNLQLSGQLSNELYIAAAITDNNIPIQPDGNTQQIQDFERVFIQIYNNNLRLTAGDFDVDNRNGYFMRFNKKAQGGLFEGVYRKQNEEGGERYSLRTVFGAAVSKGKYARQTLQAVEGNQGPYKLKGSNNETYIIVLAGTERVFIDGRLLRRGQELDYVINYNTAEITFMPGQMITKDRRIIIEFEYADRNYARAMLYSGNTLQTDRLELTVNFFSEHDMQNQSLFQELSPADKLLLESVGDSLHQAVISGAENIDFDANQVMYMLTDTLVDGISYDSIYVFSAEPNLAIYRLRFSFVGQGNGNYRQKQTTVNGRVYEWIAPENGQKQGDYEPLIQLIPPEKKQMFTSSFRYRINAHTNIALELAVSNKDINTFSMADRADNQGLGAKFSLENTKPLSRDSISPWKIKTLVTHEWTQKTFNPIERYRDAEFNRDWNLTGLSSAEEHLSGFKITAFDNTNRHLGMGLQSFFRDDAYNALQGQLNAGWQYKGLFITQNTSQTHTQIPLYNTGFLKNHTHAGYKFRYVTLGFINLFEQNRFLEKQSDTLMQGSQKFEQFEFYLQNPDTAHNKYRMFYKWRNDFGANNNAFKLASKADEAGFSADFGKSPLHRISLQTAYRHLYHLSSQLTEQGVTGDRTILGRLEYSGRNKSNFISLHAFYEFGTGMEVKKEYTYVEVQPGQGVYTWTDYNNNGIKELDEFDVAAFQDEANYIRVYVPTTSYIKAYSSTYNQILNLTPAAAWGNEKGVKKLISRFSNRTALQILKKTTAGGFEAYNPIATQINDTSLVSLNTSLRNNFSFNANASVWGMDYRFIDNSQKVLMVNGFETRSLQTHTLSLRWRVIRKVFLNLSADKGAKTAVSEFFPARNYNIKLLSAEPVLSYQVGSRFRSGFFYKYDLKENTIGMPAEKALSHTLGNETRYSKPETGQISFKVSYVKMFYNAPDNTSLSYEMLGGLKPGNNITWNLMYQRHLKNNMQLGIIYDGRKPQTEKAIHFGNVQLRAYF